jgi:hypothetical protein
MAFEGGGPSCNDLGYRVLLRLRVNCRFVSLIVLCGNQSLRRSYLVASWALTRAMRPILTLCVQLRQFFGPRELPLDGRILVSSSFVYFLLPQSAWR